MSGVALLIIGLLVLGRRELVRQQGACKHLVAEGMQGTAVFVLLYNLGN